MSIGMPKVWILLSRVVDTIVSENFISGVLPFALVTSADRMNNLHVDMNGKTPEMKFSDTIG